MNSIGSENTESVWLKYFFTGRDSDLICVNMQNISRHELGLCETTSMMRHFYGLSQ